MENENLYETDCIRTYTGKYMNVFNPHPDMICIEDIAHSLSMQCRFGGHLPVFYSVAQHCLECADLAPRGNRLMQLVMLLHDATEAYMLDIPRPIKLQLPDYKKIEDNLMEVIAVKFGINPYLFSDPLVKEIDKRMLHLEWNALMIRHPNYKRRIKPMSSLHAKLEFMNRFYTLHKSI